MNEALPNIRERLLISTPKTAVIYRSLNGTPPFDFETASVSMIETTTASAGALKFFITASVMSFIKAFFCSGERPLTAWT
jgi:hypothetical protein